MSFNLDDKQFTGNIDVIVYGQAGCRKTLSMITASKSLLVNIEHRIDSMIEYRKELDEQKRIWTVDLDTKAEGNAGQTELDLLKRSLYGNKATGGAEIGLFPILRSEKAKEKYDTIFVDSISIIGDLVKEHTIKPKNEFDYWPLMEKDFMSIVNSFIDLPYNVVFLAKRKTEKRQKLNAVGKLESFDYYNMDAYTKSIPFSLAHVIKNMFYMDTVGSGLKSKTVIYTAPSDTHAARCVKQKALNPTEVFSFAEGNLVGWDMIFDKINSYDAKQLN